MEHIFDYNQCLFVDFDHWVKIKDLDSGEETMCKISADFTPAVYKNILLDKASNPQKMCMSGEIWVHTPLGGAIIGRRVLDEFGFYSSGVLHRFKVLKIFS